jgi:hypothetical protein
VITGLDKGFYANDWLHGTQGFENKALLISTDFFSGL